MIENTYFAVLRFGIFHTVKQHTIKINPRDRMRNEPYNIVRQHMLETYPTANFVGFYGRRDYAQMAAEKADSLVMINT